MKRRGLTEHDRAAWASYARTVAPMPGITVPEAPPDPPSPLAPAPPAPEPVIARPSIQRPSPVAIGAAPGGLDNGTWTRFRTGRLSTMRTLDLHGRTANAAYAALDQFLVRAVADGVRVVEVITGRGRGEGGVIRREFPLWLNQPHIRPLILAASHPHALNPGSVRLLLRRGRR